MYSRKKTAQKISKIQTLRDPKPAHLQWAQDQGATRSFLGKTRFRLMGTFESQEWVKMKVVK